MESAAGANGSDKRKLEGIINGAVKMLKEKRLVKNGGEYKQEEAEKIIGELDKYLFFEKHFRVSRNETGVVLLLEALRTNQWDCDLTSFVYLGIADKLRLPIFAVCAPSHMFIRWVAPDWSFNWDTTRREYRSDYWYTKRSNISLVSVKNGVYLAALTRQETLAFGYHNTAYFLATEKKKWAEAIKLLDVATGLNPHIAMSFDLRGECNMQINSLKSALRDFEKSSELDPGDPYTRVHKAEAYAFNENIDKALTALDSAIDDKLKCGAIYYTRSVMRRYKAAFLEKEKPDYAVRLRKEARDDLSDACKLDKAYCSFQ